MAFYSWKPSRAHNWSLRADRGIRRSASKAASSEKRFPSCACCFTGNCAPDRESRASSRKNPTSAPETNLTASAPFCGRQCLQSSGYLRILKSGHENSASAVRSHHWRFHRKCCSHLELGGASQAARRGPCCFYRALPLRLSSPGSFGAPGLSRPERGRTESACGENSFAVSRRLCRAGEERRRQIRGQQSGAVVRRASRF